MNGTFWRSDGGEVTDDRALAFCDQLSAMVRNQTDLYELTEQRTRARLAEFEMTDHAVLVDDYLARCAERKWTARRGFIDFVQSIGQGIDAQAARQLWKLIPSTTR